MTRRERRVLISTAAAILALVAGGAAVLAGVRLHEKSEHDRAAPEVRRHWAVAQRALAARLSQPGPLEFGEVWRTRSGLICGVVNGRGSFGGLTGMTPFYVQTDKPVFALDVSAADFAPGWRDCVADHWFEIVVGSPEVGFCATQAGASRCRAVGG